MEKLEKITMDQLQLHFFSEHIKEAEKDKKLTNAEKAVLGAIGAYGTYTVANAYRNKDKYAKDARDKAIRKARRKHARKQQRIFAAAVRSL